MFFVHLGALVLGSVIGGFSLAFVLGCYKHDRMNQPIFPISCIFAVTGISYALAAAMAMFFK